jgi:TPR repeat protein
MEDSFEEIQSNAHAGLTACQIELGNAYLTGGSIGGKKLRQDFAQAKDWLERAHERGASTATYLLGTIYEDGLGVDPDMRKAIALYESAAEAGGFLPCVHLARIYARGKGVPVSVEDASKWYQRVLSFEDEVDDEGEIREARAFLGR